MDASVLAGLQSMNTSINNAAQIAAAAGDSKAAQRMHDEDIATQWAMIEQQQRYAYEANLRAHDWTQDFMNQDYQHQKEFIELQQAYNSPVNQMKLLREAGLNPALAFGQNGSQIGLGSSGSHSSPSPVGAAPAGVPSQSGYFRAPNIADPAQSFAAVAAAFQAIAQSKKTGVETDVLESSAADMARKLVADADFAEIGASLAQEFGRPEREKSLRKTDEEIANLVASTANLAKTGAYTEALEAVAKVDKLIKENERLQGEEVLKVLPDQLRAVIRNLQSQSNVNNANADRIRELLPGEKTLQDTQNKLLNAQTDYTFEQIKNSAAVRSKIAKECVLLTMEASHMQWSNEHREELYNYYIDQLERVKEMDQRTIWQMQQDYNNIFRYIGSFISGGAAAGISTAGRLENPVQRPVVSGFGR